MLGLRIAARAATLLPSRIDIARLAICRRASRIHPSTPICRWCLSLVRAFLRVAALDDGDRSDHLDVHGPKLERLKLRHAGFDVIQKLLFGCLRTVRTQARPIVGKDLAELADVTGLLRTRPIALQLFDSFGSARGRRFVCLPVDRAKTSTHE